MAPGTEPVLDTAQPHAVRRSIDGYTPQLVPPRLWERIGPTGRALMHQLDLDSTHVARTDLPMVVACLGRTVTDGRWIPEDGGWPPFDRHLVDGNCNQHLTGTLQPKGRTRTALYRVSKLLHPEQWATDVHIVAGIAVVDVDPPRPRRVPLLTGWAELDLDTADTLHDRLLTGRTLTTRHNLVSKAAERFNRGCPVRLHATRLRHTWMLDLLERGPCVPPGGPSASTGTSPHAPVPPPCCPPSGCSPPSPTSATPARPTSTNASCGPSNSCLPGGRTSDSSRCVQQAITEVGDTGYSSRLGRAISPSANLAALSVDADGVQLFPTVPPRSEDAANRAEWLQNLDDWFERFNRIDVFTARNITLPDLQGTVRVASPGKEPGHKSNCCPTCGPHHAAITGPPATDGGVLQVPNAKNDRPRPHATATHS